MTEENSTNRRRNSNDMDKEQQTNCNPATSVYQTREEYVEALQQWVNQARLWQNVSSCFPFYLMTNQMSQQNVNNVQSNVNNEPNEQPNPQQPPDAPQTQTRPVLNNNEGFEFVIPPVWKRVLAEGVDFLILFAIKLVMTLVAIEILDSAEFKENLRHNIRELHLGPDVTTGILALEAMHRILVCAYEVFWCHGRNDFRFGCATPGKQLFGITVVIANKIHPVQNADRQIVLIAPAQDLSMHVAVTRSIIKNFVLAILFPFFFAFFLFQYNRTGYDIVCSTLVVEYNPNPPKRNFIA